MEVMLSSMYNRLSNSRPTIKRRCVFFAIVPLVCVLVSLVCADGVSGQSAKKDPDWYSSEAEKAITKENYEYAIKTLKEGIALYPESEKLNVSLADLYYTKKFYELALTQYIEADEKKPDDYSIMNQIQRCYGYMNDEGKSIEVLKRMLEKYPVSDHTASYNTVDDLAWMYYKTHRLEEGEKLILDTLAGRSAYDVNQGLHMTLGTIYSGMYDYENSKKYYLMAIDEAKRDGDTYFVSIAYYNLSLLEHNFSNYNSALLYTDEALRNEERATGHLSKGELYQSQMNYAQTMEEYERGMALDETPLTMIDMAVANRLFGRLDDSLSYARKVLDSRDQSWMLNFGTDVTRHKKELYRIMAEAYEGLGARESLLPGESIVASALSLWDRIGYGLARYYYDQKYKTASIKVGKQYLAEKNLLDAYREFYNANEDYRSVALEYLAKAEEIETALIPKSEALYVQETGMRTRSAEMLVRSMTMFDPFWEKEALADSLRYLVDVVGARTVAGRTYANRLYEINPGGLVQYGFGLPMEVRFELSGKMRIMSRLLPKLLEDAGSEIALENRTTNAGNGFTYVLKIGWHEGANPTFSLVQSEKERVVKQGALDVGKGNPHVLAARFVRTLLQDHVYVAGN